MKMFKKIMAVALTAVMAVSMLTGCAIGLFACIDEASRHFVQQGETFSPHAVNSAVYDKLFARYRRLYSAMKEVWL